MSFTLPLSTSYRLVLPTTDVETKTHRLEQLPRPWDGPTSAMSGSSSPKATPKRKRDEFIREHKLPSFATEQLLPHSVFTFEIPGSAQAATLEDGSNSPRTQTANKFRNLSLDKAESGAPSSSPTDAIASQQSVFDNHPILPTDCVVFGHHGAINDGGVDYTMQLDEDEDVAIRKRHKPLALHDDGNGETDAETAGPVKLDDNNKSTLDAAVDPNMVRVIESEFSGGRLKKSYPSINRLADSKSRGRRRSATPPASASRRKSTTIAEEEPIIVDPIRAALTWHEDEITVYDSEDPNDDGTGLNGIGFRPTPAIAYQRAQRRKKQLSEYKKREETEARALRNQKRREALGGGSELTRHHSVMRVRFSEAEPETLVTT